MTNWNFYSFMGRFKVGFCGILKLFFKDRFCTTFIDSCSKIILGYFCTFYSYFEHFIFSFLAFMYLPKFWALIFIAKCFLIDSINKYLIVTFSKSAQLSVSNKSEKLKLVPDLTSSDFNHKISGKCIQWMYQAKCFSLQFKHAEDLQRVDVILHKFKSSLYDKRS